MTPDCAPSARRGVERHAAWLRNYRRSATSLAARGSDVVFCSLDRKGRHSATGLMARNKGQRRFEPMLTLYVTGISKLRRRASQAASFESATRQLRGEQSGDRQRREKGEHERATPVCESRPTSLRATLRAPPSKWAIKAFFPAGERSEPRPRTAPKGLPQTEAWAERERVPSGHNCRRQLATGRPEQIQEPGTAVPGTPIFANNAQRGGPPLESPCRWLSLVLSFASKESTTPLGAAAHPSAP